MAVADCRLEAETVAPVTDWHFRLDPTNAGISDSYFTYNDKTVWDNAAPGVPWEEQGYIDYDGVAWYHTTYNIPPHWQNAYLGTTQADDIARVWINQQEVPFSELISLPLGEVEVVYRIEDLGGLGGIKRPVIVGNQPYSALPGGDYVRYLANQTNNIPFPAWAHGEYHAWTFTGAPLAENEAIITAEASVAPYADVPPVSLWLMDYSTGALHTPNTPKFSLVDEFLPMPQATWQMGGLEFDSRLFTGFDNAGTFYQISAHNPTTQTILTQLLLAVPPFSVSNDRQPIYTAYFVDNNTLQLNGSAYLRASLPADSTHLTHLNDFPTPITDAPTTCAPDGNAVPYLRYKLALEAGDSWELDLTFPTEPDKSPPNPARANAQFDQTRANWQAELANPDFTIPDGFVTNAYLASLGNLLIALDPDGPHPRPTGTRCPLGARCCLHRRNAHCHWL